MQFFNKTLDSTSLTLQVEGVAGGTISKVGEQSLNIPANGAAEGVFFIELPPEALEGMKTKITIGLYQEGERLSEVSTNFMGPAR